MRKILLVALPVLIAVTCCQTLAGQAFDSTLILFNKGSISLKNLNGLQKLAQRIEAIAAVQQQVIAQKPKQLKLEFPVDGKLLMLTLYRAEVFSAGTTITEALAGGLLKPLAAINAVYYRGKVEGQNSLVALSFFEDEITGLIELPTGSWNLGHLKNHTESATIHYLYNSDNIVDKQAFNCGNNGDQLLKPIDPSALKSTETLTTVGSPVDFYIETDYQTYLNNASNGVKVIKWVGSVMNAVEAIYENENIRVQVRGLKVWGIADPYIAGTTTTSALTLFQNQMAAGFNGDLAHLFSQRDLGGGRAAGIDVLCSTANMRTAVSGSLVNEYLPVNDYGWDIYVVTHEAGHCLGSPHTHDCSWPGGAIDNCYAPQGSCATGPALPPGGGTIMSYCHQPMPITGIITGIRLSNGFGPLPGNLIRSKVTDAACLSNCNNLTATLTKTDATCAALGTASLLVSGGTAPITYLWSNGATTASQTNMARGSYYVTVKSATTGCEIIKGFDITETPGACPNITNFTSQNGTTGSSVIITGTNFTGATTVSFGGTPASSFSVSSPTTINAVVGAGSSGTVAVSSPSGIGGMGGFLYCATPATSFTNPQNLGTITGGLAVAGNNFAINCHLNQFTSTSTPGHVNGHPGNDKFYKFTTGACVYKLDITVCPQLTQDSYLWLLDSVGTVIGESDNAAIAGCSSSYGSAIYGKVLAPLSTYYLVVESYTANTDINWTLTIQPTNACITPIIYGFTPVYGNTNTEVTITGNNFVDVQNVKIGGIDIPFFNVNSATEIVISLPSDLSPGRISVTAPLGTAYSSTSFALATNNEIPGGIKLCPGGSTVIYAPPGSNTYQWQVDAGLGFGYTDIIDNGSPNYTGAATRVLNIDNAPSYFYNYTYRCIIDGAPAGIPVNLTFENNWTPATDNTWETVTNWGCANKLPDANTDAKILSGNVQLNTSTYVKSLSVQPGASFTAKNGIDLKLGYKYQNTAINRLYGGSGSETGPVIIPTPDDGWVMASGSSSSLNGDITGTGAGLADCWITKMNGAGKILWSRLIGGTSIETVYSIKATPDGGYILAASSSSANISGTSNTNNGGTDVWVAKLNSEGIAEWSRFYGGSGTDLPAEILATADGGYILAGTTYSSASFDVTGTNNGGADYWVLKLNATGGIQWNKTLGGEFEDAGQGVIEMDDGYVIAGYSRSSASGDVTQVNNGGSDYWIVKLNLSGNIAWLKLLGGSQSDDLRSITKTADGGFALTGSSSSSASGDVTGTSNGASDFWIVKFSAAGFVEWNKLYGGSSNEFSYNIRATVDDGLIITGSSSSSNTGNVTGNAFGGTIDFWVIKLNSSGNLLWNKIMGGIGTESSRAIAESSDGNFIIAGNASSTTGNTGMLTGVVGKGGNDIWVIKINKLGEPW